MPPTLLELVQRSAQWLGTKGIANARREAEWIFAETLGLSRIELYTRFDMPLDPPEVERLRELVARRGRREPLAYILGSQEFRGLSLVVTPAVLVPRPETADLVGAVLAALPESATRVLDVGTGSGAIALALKHARPALAVTASDASEEALAVARANAGRLGLEIAFRRGHLAQGIDGPFDAVVANLPYVADDEHGLCDPELAFEPAQALYVAGDGLGLIRELIADAPRLLAPGAGLWLEHGFAQGAAVRAAAEAVGLMATTGRDGGDHERWTVCRAR